MIWEYDLNEILTGFQEDQDTYHCVICNECYEKGKIFQEQDGLYDARGAAMQHMKKKHRNMAYYLLGQELSLTGLSEIQNKLLSMILEGKTDQEIGKELGIAQSTVRNHRYKLREREKQAKLFLALMTSLEEETNRNIAKSDTGLIQEIHNTATMVDDRYMITDKEVTKTLATYLDENGALLQFPAKEKKKIIILREIMENFKKDTEYSEAEVDKVLKRIFEDHTTLRRALIEYGFMDRSDDCKIYRVKE
ncbi:MAG TPA: DUF2087 domain-containing protein [Lachnospiraceae bacterium]|nr:DUF2087 domain-containing protein [Lachnospiraceae bacterium]